LDTARGKELAKQKQNDGKEVYIITRRQKTASEEVYKVADELGIPHSRVYFTNGAMKLETVKRLEIGTHYDNNQQEIDLINKNTDTQGIKF